MQAQRKFAQIYSAGHTSFVSPNQSTSGGQPQGNGKSENQTTEPPQELLPNRRPNTEDFLTFLCFRGTSVLPSHLDFFNTNKASATSTSTATASTTHDPNDKINPSSSGETNKSTAKAPDSGVKKEKEIGEKVATTVRTDHRQSKDKEKDSEKKKTEEKDKSVVAIKEETNEATFPFAVRKRADTVASGTRRQAVQALKKKYQEQRIAKDQAKCNTKQKSEKPPSTEATKSVKNEKNEANGSANVKRKLRGNSSVNENELENCEEKSSSTKTMKTSKEPSAKAISNGTAKMATRQTKSLTPAPKTKPDETKHNEESVNDEMNVRSTRHRNYSLPLKRQSKAFDDDGEKKSAEKPPKKAIRTSTASKSVHEVESDSVTSDDDKPLMASDKKKPKANTSLSKEKTTTKTQPRKRRSNRGQDSSLDRQSNESSKISEPTTKRKSLQPPTTSKGKSTAENNSKNEAIKTRRSTLVADESHKSEGESQLDTDKESKKVRKKRRNEFTDLSQTDQSENENKTGRPMRKTKEAATIYMELIGQKLNLSGSEDENFSMDSFPELPNVRKTEQMENDMRANLSRDKRESMSTPKRSKSKKIDGNEKNEKNEKNKKSVEVPFLDDKDASAKSNGGDASRPITKDATKSTGKTNAKATNAKLEKSFSDSDDEPLATKVTRKVKSPRKKTKATAEETKENEQIKNAKTTSTKSEKVEAKKEANVATLKKNEKLKNETDDEKCRLTKQTTPKSIDLNDSGFKMPAESVTQLLSPPITVSPIKAPFNSKLKTTTPSKESAQSSPSAKHSTQSISAILADLNSSKEDGKIFGIASVTLAQSSGPNDTKCTLGKCGSVHKPPLGPVVPVDNYINEHMTSRERRKAKVNMTHEQIEKWLLQCSNTEKVIDNDSLDEEIDLTVPLKPIDYSTTPSPTAQRDKDAIKEESTSKSTETPRSSMSKVDEVAEKSDDKEAQKAIIASTASKEGKKSIETEKIKVETKRENVDVTKKSTVNDSPVTPSTKPTPTSSSSQSKAPTTISTTTPPDKKPIYNRRTPVYTKMSTTQQMAPNPTGGNVKTFGAFSPENEASIYSFDKEEDSFPTSLPFRRPSRRGSTHSRTEETAKTSTKNDDANDKSTSPKKQQISMTLSPEDNSKSAAIGTVAAAENSTATKKNVDEKETKKTNATTIIEKTNENDGKDSDSEGHTFYIPLNCMGTMNDGSSDQLIQGVAVKLGTEGPEGPNQKVIMHAKLVTKSQMGSNTTPIPEGIANVHEIVKNLISSKEGVNFKSMTIPSQNAVEKKPKASTSTAENKTTSAQTTTTTTSTTTTKAKQPTGKRAKNESIIQPCNNTAFPHTDDPAQMVEAPVFRPTEKEFSDPIEFINRIAPIAARFGLCRIIPPSNFKPECKISDDMRFTAYNQYVHKMLHRWGPNVKELSAIKKYLATQSITLTQAPLIGGMEVDLPRLYHTVQECGGLKEVIEKKKWTRVAEEMCIPKTAQDRVTKLDDIYCKYLLPYDTLSPNERQKLFDEVEADWAKSEAKARRNADRTVSSESNGNENFDDEDASASGDGDGDGEDDDDEDEDESSDMECIIKGKSMALSAFFRVARNTMTLWFKNSEPSSSEIESEFWRHVAVRDSHVCVHSGSIDSSGWGYGFPAPGPKTKNSTCSKHPWNLKVLTNNQNSVLRSIGPVTGVTVPTLHVGMLFSACCWYRDPHGLPWIEYLHTGGSKIWYSVPNEQSDHFRAAFSSLVPTHCQNKTVWLPCDTAMVPPHMLTDRNVSLCRTEQEPGQFVVVFPRAYTSNLCSGYSISESVYFAPMSWLETAREDFKVSRINSDEFQ